MTKKENTEKFVVRAHDDDFVEKETFESFEEAIAYADKMGEIFGSWNVDLYRI